MGFIPAIEELSCAVIRWVQSKGDLTLMTSPQMKEEFKQNGVPRVDVWRKGIDTVRFDPKFKCQSMRERMTDGNPDDFLMVWGGEEAQGHQAGAGEAWTESEALHRGEGSAAGGAQGALRGHQHGVHGAVERGRVEQRVRQRRCLHDAQRLGNPRLRRPGEHGLRCPRRRLRRWRNSRPHPRRRHRLPRPAGRHRRVHCLRRKARGP
mmetsp:Transcript_9185/g.19884  ORF Transcript_9185/g.19884 Transcript_9185/m.19884 type:complete len:207 (-) Transcript_9185:485-1105(-)